MLPSASVGCYGSQPGIPRRNTGATVTERRAHLCQPCSHTNATINATANKNAGRGRRLARRFPWSERRKRRDSNPRTLAGRSLSSRRGAVCRGMSQAVELRVFARSVWLGVGQTAVGCYTAATRRHPVHQPCGVVRKRRHGGRSRGRWRPAKAPVDRLAMGPGAVLTEPV
jgi:hypothetical protein